MLNNSGPGQASPDLKNLYTVLLEVANISLKPALFLQQSILFPDPAGQVRVLILCTVGGGWHKLKASFYFSNISGQLLTNSRPRWVSLDLSSQVSLEPPFLNIVASVRIVPDLRCKSRSKNYELLIVANISFKTSLDFLNRGGRY